jgi:hypothetical protein
MNCLIWMPDLNCLIWTAWLWGNILLRMRWTRDQGNVLLRMRWRRFVSTGCCIIGVWKRTMFYWLATANPGS